METTEKRGLVKFFIDAVLSPKAAIEEFVERASFWPMAIVSMLIGLGLYIPIIPKVKEASLWALENSPQKVPPEQLEMVKEMMPAITAGQTAMQFFLPLIIWLVISLVFKFFNLFLGSEAPFKKLMAAAVISYVPLILANVIKTPLVMLTPASNIQDVSTSAALLLSEPKGFLFGFLSAVDPFMIWSLALLAIGTAKVLNRKIKTTGVLVTMLWGIYAIFLGGTVALSTRGM